MAVIHKGVDKIINGSGAEVVIADIKATIDNQVNKANAVHSHNINDLNDVTVTGASPGQVLSYTSDLNNTGVPGWEPATVSTSGGSGATSMAQLTDVDLSTAPSNTQILQYNGTHWVPAAPPSGSGGGGGTSNVATLDDLSDVDVTTNPPADAQVLTYQSGTWTAQTLPAAATGGVSTINQLNDVNTAGASAGDLLTYSTDIDGNGTAGWATTTPTAAGTSSVGALNDLTDVDTHSNAPTGSQVLTWDGTANLWKPATPTGTDSTVLANSSIKYTNDGTDEFFEYGATPDMAININAPADRDALVYDQASQTWINEAQSSTTLSNAGIEFSTDGTDNYWTVGATSQTKTMNLQNAQNGQLFMYQNGELVNSPIQIETY